VYIPFVPPNFSAVAEFLFLNIGFCLCLTAGWHMLNLQFMYFSYFPPEESTAKSAYGNYVPLGHPSLCRRLVSEILIKNNLLSLIVIHDKISASIAYGNISKGVSIRR